MSYNDPRGAAMQTRTVEQASAAAHSVRRAQAATSSIRHGIVVRRSSSAGQVQGTATDTRKHPAFFRSQHSTHTNAVGGGSGRQKP